MSDKELISVLVLIIASLLEEQNKPFTMHTLREHILKYSAGDCVELIDAWVRTERGRTALKRHLLDGVSTEAVSEEIDRSPRQTSRIIKRAGAELFEHI